MEFNFRRATEKDNPALIIILEEARLFKKSLGDEAWGDDPFSAEEVSEMINGGTYLAAIDDQIAGCVALYWNDERVWGNDLGNDNQAGYIHRLVTGNDFRGQGLGEQILGQVYEVSKRKGKIYTRLDCSTDNKKLCRYYENLGFERTGLKVLGTYTAALYQKVLS